MEFEVTGAIADPVEAWRRLGDTDYVNRALGNEPITDLTLTPLTDGFPALRGRTRTPLGEGTFEETETAWVTGRWFHQARDFVTGPFARTQYDLRLSPRANGVVPTLRFEVEPRGLLARSLGKVAFTRVEAKARALVRSLPAPAATIPEPMAERSLGGDALAALRSWEAEAGDIARHFADHLRSAPSTELQRMRAYGLADQWGLDRDEVLVASLRGVRHGALEMYWSVRCPRCHAQVAGVAELSNIADHAECGSCRVAFSPDLAENVEVLFSAHPSVVPRVNETFCTLFPAQSPGVHALFFVRPGQRVEDVVPLPRGSYVLGAAGNRWPDQQIRASAAGKTEHHYAPGDVEPANLVAGDVALRLENPTDSRLRIQVLAPSPETQQVPASRLTSMPEFRRQMGEQVLGRDQRIAVRSVVLLFTDLSGSTSMYEEAGDATAFQVIRDHFTVLRKATEANGGVIVKTIGDAVMAAFHTAEEAMRAALEMHSAYDVWVASLGLSHPPGLRVGIHRGPALCVHTDQSGLDYFGRTVNIAARTEAKAEPGEIAWTEAVHERVATLVGGLEVHRMEAELKGIRETLTLYRARVIGRGPADRI